MTYGATYYAIFNITSFNKSTLQKWTTGSDLPYPWITLFMKLWFIQVCYYTLVALAEKVTDIGLLCRLGVNKIWPLGRMWCALLNAYSSKHSTELSDSFAFIRTRSVITNNWGCGAVWTCKRVPTFRRNILRAPAALLFHRRIVSIPITKLRILKPSNPVRRF